MHKILYISRLFSGLEQSLIKEYWSPTGVPTIYKFIEHLQTEEFNCEFIFAAKGGFSSYKATANRKIQLSGFDRPITILHSHYQIEHKFIGKIWRELCHFSSIAFRAILFRPSIIYIDHANIWSAGIFARFTPFKVVFRIMGVYPAMRLAVESKKPTVSQRLLRWLYKSPFALVICTQDGSGIENWLAKSLRADVQVEKLMNGVIHLPSRKEEHENSKIVITFLGKLEEAKGAKQFVEAACNVLKTQKNKFTINVIGFGSLRESLINKVKIEKFEEAFNFKERIPHREVASILNQTDIYVSLNRLGNLSNANLEAISAGCCIIMPKSQHQNGIDLFTDELLPHDAAWRIESADDINGLSFAIQSLATDITGRKKMGAAAREVGKTFDSWDGRVKTELALLNSLIGN